MSKHERVYDIVSNIIGKDAEYIKANEDKPGLWDSLKRVEIVFSLEEQFDIMLSPEEIAELNTVKSIIELVEKQ